MTNATGAYKSKLLIIGKFSKPQCLKNIELKNLPATYRSGPNAWMNFCIFQEFLISFNNEMIMKNKRVLLILDNFSAHVAAANANNLSNITIQFIRPNLTSTLQPCDGGIIHSFKAKYRKMFLEKLSHDCMHDKRNKFTLKDALIMASDSWEALKSEIISSCWRKVNIMSKDLEIINDSSLIESENSDLIEISFLISSSNIDDSLDADNYLNVENELDREVSNDSDIVQRIMIENNLITNHNEDDSFSDEDQPTLS